MNGTASYIDHTDFPCPAIRFKENTPDVLALREKEKGEWKALTLDEKKARELFLFIRSVHFINTYD